MVKESFSLSLKQVNEFARPKVLVLSVSAPHGPASVPTGPHQDRKCNCHFSVYHLKKAKSL